MVKRIEYAFLDCPPEPPRRVIAWVRDQDSLEALVEFRGTTQRGFYVVSKFEGGSKTPVVCFPTVPSLQRLHEVIYGFFGFEVDFF
jgi:hypothetical protein